MLRDKKKWSTDLTGGEPEADRQGSAFLLGKYRRARDAGNDGSRDVAIWVLHGVAPPVYPAEDTPFRREINTPGSVGRIKEGEGRGSPLLRSWPGPLSQPSTAPPRPVRVPSTAEQEHRSDSARILHHTALTVLPQCSKEETRAQDLTSVCPIVSSGNRVFVALGGSTFLRGALASCSTTRGPAPSPVAGALARIDPGFQGRRRLRARLIRRGPGLLHGSRRDQRPGGAEAGR